MVKHLNLNALRVFATAARFGNFQRAAEELNISHGAVSQRIKQLERDLGTVLFDRQPRGVSLTTKGERYCKSVDDALSILTTATADLERSNQQVTLHLGASFLSKWLMPRMNDFHALFPDVSLTTQTHEDLIEHDLGRNEIAVWPSIEPEHNPAHQIIRLCELKLVAVCSPNLLRPDWPIDIKELLTLPLLQDAHLRWEHLIATSGHQATRSILNFGRSALALDAAIHGHGVAIAPTLMIEADVRAKRLVEIWHSPDASGEYLFLSYSKQYAHEKSIKQSVDWILSEFGVSTAVAE